MTEQAASFDPFSSNSRESGGGSWMNFSDAFGEATTDLVEPDIVADKKESKKKSSSDKKSSKKSKDKKDDSDDKKEKKKKKTKSKDKDGSVADSATSSSKEEKKTKKKITRKNSTSSSKASKDGDDSKKTKKKTKKKVKELTKEEAEAAMQSGDPNTPKLVKKVVKRKKKKPSISEGGTDQQSSSQKTDPTAPLSPTTISPFSPKAAPAGKVVITPTAKKKKKAKGSTEESSSAENGGGGEKLSDKIKKAQAEASSTTSENKLPAWKLRELVKQEAEEPKRHFIEVEDTAKTALKLIGGQARGAPPRKSQFGYYTTPSTSKKPAVLTKTPTAGGKDSIPSMFVTTPSAIKPSVADTAHIMSAKTPRRMLKKDAQSTSASSNDNSVGLGDHFGKQGNDRTRVESDMASTGDISRLRTRRQKRQELEHDLNASSHHGGAGDGASQRRGRSIPRRHRRAGSHDSNDVDNEE
jgi:hypothetical protein